MICEEIIKVEGLTKKFNGFTAVDKISFSVKKGEIFAFLGPNGAGKTTTIKMLTTLLKPDEGSAEVDCSDIKTQKHKVDRNKNIIKIGLNFIHH